MTTNSSVKNQLATLLLVAATLITILAASFSAMWLVGTLGVSATTAGAIANAVEAGSWAMFLASITATGGLVGVGMWGALKLMMKKAGKDAVVA